MKEVYPNLWIGGQDDYEGTARHESAWRIVQACHSPYHKEALGYRGEGAPKNHPEYLMAYREQPKRLILNMIDADTSQYFRRDLFDAAFDFIQEGLGSGDRVLVHCNMGYSRGPSIGLLFMASKGLVIPSSSLRQAAEAFLKIYPKYQPGTGVWQFMEEHWDEYCPST